VASTLLGDGRIQQDGPELGLDERATAPEDFAYYARVLRERMLASERCRSTRTVTTLVDGQFVPRLTGKRYEVRNARRVVDARYLPHRYRLKSRAVRHYARGLQRGG
jgi:hypothetical protein